MNASAGMSSAIHHTTLYLDTAVRCEIEKGVTIVADEKKQEHTEQENAAPLTAATQAGGSAPRECSEVMVKESASNLTITCPAGVEYEVTITVSGSDCRSVRRCHWDGQQWIC